jgi:hypothetical protein
MYVHYWIRRGDALNLTTMLEQVEHTLIARYRESAAIRHAGDRGENREAILRNFLSDNLPKRYGVTKGEVITPEGEHSFAADIIVYDALNCPVLYAGETKILPIEGVYGVIEVKSRLSKHQLVDALGKLASFKALPVPLRTTVQTYSVGHEFTPSRPFGIIFAFDLDGNSIDSLKVNYRDWLHGTDVSLWTNLIVVLNESLIRIHPSPIQDGDSLHFLDSLVLVRHVLDAKKKDTNAVGEFILTSHDLQSRTFGRFFVYLLVMLERMRLSIPNLQPYISRSVST